MILQKKLASNATTFPNQNIVYMGTPQQSLTLPDQAMNLEYAMKQYKRGSLEERAKGYYETKGFESPDFDRMSKIEKLMALAEYRRLLKSTSEELNSINSKIIKHESEVLEQQKAAKAERGKENAKHPDTAGKDGGDRQGK